MQDPFFKDATNFEIGNNITINSANLEPSHQHWQANQASDNRTQNATAAPCFSSQLLTYREQSHEPLNGNGTLDDRSTRLNSSYKPPHQ